MTRLKYSSPLLPVLLLHESSKPIPDSAGTHSLLSFRTAVGTARAASSLRALRLTGPAQGASESSTSLGFFLEEPAINASISRVRWETRSSQYSMLFAQIESRGTRRRRNRQRQKNDRRIERPHPLKQARISSTSGAEVCRDLVRRSYALFRIYGVSIHVKRSYSPESKHRSLIMPAQSRNSLPRTSSASITRSTSASVRSKPTLNSARRSPRYRAKYVPSGAVR